jgi:hypothetical protein
MYPDWEDTQIETVAALSDISTYRFVTNIREPFKRYVTGVCQYEDRTNRMASMSLKQNKFIMDEHTTPQYDFLEPFIELGVEIDALVMNENFERNFQRYYYDGFMSSCRYIPKIPISNKNKNEHRKEQVEKMIDYDEWIKVFVNDLMLFNEETTPVNLIQ